MVDTTGTRLVSDEIETSVEVVHDFKTPVATILGSLGTLQKHWDSLDDEGRKKLIGLATEAVEQLADFAELLTVSVDPPRLDLPE